jgi:hypothetical protein
MACPNDRESAHTTVQRRLRPFQIVCRSFGVIPVLYRLVDQRGHHAYSRAMPGRALMK